MAGAVGSNRPHAVEVPGHSTFGSALAQRPTRQSQESLGFFLPCHKSPATSAPAHRLPVASKSRPSSCYRPPKSAAHRCRGVRRATDIGPLGERGEACSWEGTQSLRVLAPSVRGAGTCWSWRVAPQICGGAELRGCPPDTGGLPRRQWQHLGRTRASANMAERSA